MAAVHGVAERQTRLSPSTECVPHPLCPSTHPPGDTEVVALTMNNSAVRAKMQVSL